jgi:hypothetical protein
MEWRIWLAKQIGINLLEMEGFSDREYFKDGFLNKDRKFGTIKWETVTDDLKHLLNHSDCDGHITPTNCKKIAKRLKEVIGDRKIPKMFDFENADGIHLISTKQFMDGCMKAFKNKQNLKFH